MGTASSGGGTYFYMNGHSQTIGPLTGTAPPNGPQIQLTGTLDIIQTNNTTFPGVILSAGGSLTLDSASTSTLTLSGTNTYTGPTTINGGTLALSGSGAIGSSPTITVAGGATFDVSARTTALTLGTSQTLKVGGTSGSSATIATASGEGLTLGASSPLQFTAYDGSTVPLTISGAGSLAIGTGNAVTITTTTRLTSSSYKLVQIGSGNTTAVTGTPATSVTINGSGAAGTGSLRVTDGELYLDIQNLAPVTQMSIRPGSGGSFTINYSGGGGSQFVLLQTNKVAAPLINWTRLKTNTLSPGSFTITPGSDPAEFYRVKSE
jgi:autotransporter-associated beta strand protein